MEIINKLERLFKLVNFTQISWEYEVIIIPANEFDELKNVLNELGTLGWELINEHYVSSGYAFIFKRRMF